MLKKLDFNFVIIAYILLMAVIILGTTTKDQAGPKQLLIKQYQTANEMQYQSELLFKKGWQITDLEAYNNGSTSRSEFIVLYQR